jgi:hypothetical protein
MGVIKAVCFNRVTSNSQCIVPVITHSKSMGRREGGRRGGLGSMVYLSRSSH